MMRSLSQSETNYVNGIESDLRRNDDLIVIVTEEEELSVDTVEPTRYSNHIKIKQTNFQQDLAEVPDLIPRNYLVPNQLTDGSQISISEESPKKYVCDVCLVASFSKSFSLKRHKMIHSGERPHKCEQCPKSFVQKTDLKRHETTHSDKKSFSCYVPGCGKKFKTKKNLSSHEHVHINVRPYKCNHCPKTFKVRRLWRFHELNHASNDEKQFQCEEPGCSKGFPAKSYLKSHLKHCHNNFERSFLCPLCNAGFKRKHELKFHCKHVHVM